MREARVEGQPHRSFDRLEGIQDSDVIELLWRISGL